MKIELNTAICPIVNVGMYQTHLSPGNMFDSEVSEILASEFLSDAEKEHFCDQYYDNFNTAAYEKVAAKYAMEALDDFIGGIAEHIKLRLLPEAEIISPREYNFYTDELYFTVEAEQTELDKILPAVCDDEWFWQWAKKYTSYDGFLSFMPCYKDDFAEAINGEDISRALALYLTYLHESANDFKEPEFGYNYYIYENISDNHGVTEFIDDAEARNIAYKAWSSARELEGQLSFSELTETA